MHRCIGQSRSPRPEQIVDPAIETILQVDGWHRSQRSLIGSIRCTGCRDAEKPRRRSRPLGDLEQAWSEYRQTESGRHGQRRGRSARSISQPTTNADGTTWAAMMYPTPGVERWTTLPRWQFRQRRSRGEEDRARAVSARRCSRSPAGSCRRVTRTGLGVDAQRPGGQRHAEGVREHGRAGGTPAGSTCGEASRGTSG